MKIILLILGSLLIAAFGLVVILKSFSNSQVNIPSINSESINTPQGSANNEEKIRVIASGLNVPWALAFLPNNEILVTERVGKVKRISGEGQVIEIGAIAEVKQYGEGGLHGIALHPDFDKNGLVYFYYTFSSNGDNTSNRVVRFKLEDNQLKNQEIIVDNIPGAIFHDGGRIKFGPDKNLYITTGDARVPSLSQDTSSLAGKILRVTPEGKAVSGNPFGNQVYSYGHRNPQGIAWDDQGRLWEVEHGESALDEVNLIEIGKNYGWPTIRGDQTRDGMISPIVHSGSATWAPSGMASKNGKLYFAGLRGVALFEINADPTNPDLKKSFENEYGRIREAILGPEGFLYITTNNTDGRGIPKANDDKIIRLKI